MRFFFACFTAGVIAVAAACSSSDAKSPAGPALLADAGAPSDGAAAEAGPAGDASVCERTPKAADRVRNVVVSHPTDQSGGKGHDFEVLHLDQDGKLTRDGARFSMGRTFDSPILFTPDGEIGVAVQDEDGTLGIFRFDVNGAPVVIDPGFGKSTFYAQSAVFTPDGSRLYVTDVDVNSGGVHEIAIGCDGTPTYKGMVLPAPGASAIAFLPGSNASQGVLVNWIGPSAKTKDDLSIVDFAGFSGAQPKRTTTISLFGDGEGTPKVVALTPDGQLGLVPDTNDVVGTNRVGVFSLDGGLKKVAVLDVEGPSGVVTSPYGNAALVTKAGGPAIDGMHVLKIDPANATTPVTDKGELTPLAGPKPQLPTGPVVLSAGGLKGLVLIAEVEGLRRVRFKSDGSVIDMGVFTLQGGYEASVGGIGVQP
jgi:hypothetical protein